MAPSIGMPRKDQGMRGKVTPIEPASGDDEYPNQLDQMEHSEEEGNATDAGGGSDGKGMKV